MIAVVGANVSGLTAAARLADQGRDVRVFEASDEIGGLAGTTPTSGDPIEAVPVSFSRPRDGGALSLLADLGLADSVEWHATRTGAYVDGIVHPLDTPWEFFAAPHLSLSDTARLAALTSGIDVRGVPRRRPTFGAYDDREAFLDAPAKRFCQTHASARVYDRFFRPRLEAQFGSHAPRISAAWLLDRLRGEREKTRFGREIRGFLAGGVARFLDALTDAIDPDRIHTNTAVTAIDLKDGTDGTEVESATVDRAGELGTERHAVDAVVVATGPDELERLTGYRCSLPMTTRTCVRIATTTPLTDVYRTTIADDYPFDELVAATAPVPADRYVGDHQYFLLDGGRAADRDQSLATVERRWLEAFSASFPAFDRNDLRSIESTRFRQPVYEAGYPSALVPLDLSETVAEGVYYAGIASAPQYPTRRVSGAIDAGVACVDRLSKRDRNRQPRRTVRL